MWCPDCRSIICNCSDLGNNYKTFVPVCPEPIMPCIDNYEPVEPAITKPLPQFDLFEEKRRWDQDLIRAEEDRRKTPYGYEFIST